MDEATLMKRFIKLLRESVKIVYEITKKAKEEKDFSEELEYLIENTQSFLFLSEILKEILTEFEIGSLNDAFNASKESLSKIKKMLLDKSIPIYLNHRLLRELSNLENEKTQIFFIISNRSLERGGEQIPLKFIRVKQFLQEKSLINSHWPAAVLLLQSIEMVINKKLLEKGLDWQRINFKERLNQLGINIEEGDVILNNAFWDLRTEVLHKGILPNKEQLDIISIGSEMLLKKILS